MLSEKKQRTPLIILMSALLVIAAAAYLWLDKENRTSAAEDPVLSALFGTYEVDEVLASGSTIEAATIRLKTAVFKISASRIIADRYSFRNPEYILEELVPDEDAPWKLFDLMEEAPFYQYTVLRSNGIVSPLKLYISDHTVVLAIDKNETGARPFGAYYVLRRVDPDAAGILSPAPIEADTVRLSWTATWVLPPKKVELTSPEAVQKLVDLYNGLRISETDESVRLQNIVVTYYLDSEAVATATVDNYHVCTIDTRDLQRKTLRIENEDFKYSELLAYF